MTEVTTVTLITGPNRGIGRGILATLLARPKNTVIAAVRDPASDASKALDELPKGEGSSLIVTKIDQAIPTDAAEAVKSLNNSGITRIDTVVANAAMVDFLGPVIATPIEDLRRHMDVNFIGIFALFQAVEPLLRNGNNPKFIAVTSELGSNTLAIPGPWFCYGVTKAALNHMVRRIHIENDWLTATALQPGFTQSDMGNWAAKFIGMEGAPLKLEDSVKGCVKVIDAASREKYAGEWVDYEEKPIPW